MARPRKEVDQSTYEGRFAARLKALREKAGLTIKETAEEIGVTADAVYRWESGLNFPRISFFPPLAKLYGLKRGRDILPAE